MNFTAIVFIDLIEYMNLYIWMELILPIYDEDTLYNIIHECIFIYQWQCNMNNNNNNFILFFINVYFVLVRNGDSSWLADNENDDKFVFVYYR